MPTIELQVRKKPFERFVVAYYITLKGRNRHLRCNFFFNRMSNCRATDSIITYLPAFLRAKFGESAYGVRVDNTVYRNDEDMMRDAGLKTGGSYFVVYEDYTPSYAEAVEQPPVYQPAETDRQRAPRYDDPLVHGYMKPAYFDRFVYYPEIALRKKRFYIRLSFGRKASIELSNVNPEHVDSLRYQLIEKAGYKARALLLDDGRQVCTDDALWMDEIQDGECYKVAYVQHDLMTGLPKVPEVHPLYVPGPQPSPSPSRESRTSQDTTIPSRRRFSHSSLRPSLYRLSSRASRMSDDSQRTPAVRAK
ncbi:hypothetical protein PYCC9005_001101 [Savitreella phatthalungensis]